MTSLSLQHESRLASPATILLFALLAFALPYYLISELHKFELDAAVGLLYFALLHASFRLASLAHSGEQRLLSLTFWLFVYVWGVLSALLQVGADVFPWKRQHSDDDQFVAAALLVLALLSFEIGSLLAARKARDAQPRAWVLSLSSMAGVGILAIVLASLAVVMLGGPGAVIGTRGDAAQAFWREGGTTASKNLIEAMLRGPPYVACLALVFVLKTRWRALHPRDRRILLLVLAAIAPVMFVANYPGALSRGWLGTLALSFGFLLVPWRAWTMHGLITGLIVALVFVFPYADRNRARTTTETVAEPVMAASVAHSPVVPLLTKGDYDVFVQFVNAGIYARETDFMYGRNLLGAVLFWVPRRWWPDKPWSTGFEIGLHLHASNRNLSTPLWAEAYVAFGALGIVLVMAAYGYVIGRADRRYVGQVRAGVSWGALRLLVPFWAGYQIFFLRGPLMHTVAYCSFALLLLLAMVKWGPVRRPGQDLDLNTSRPGVR